MSAYGFICVMVYERGCLACVVISWSTIMPQIIKTADMPCVCVCVYAASLVLYVNELARVQRGHRHYYAK